MHALRTIAALTIGVASLTGCADDGPSTDASAEITSAATPSTVEIERSRFDTVELVVPAGTTVTFRNLDEFAHTVTSREGSPVAFDSGDLARGETFSFTFDEPGEYRYFCRIHPTMRAVVVVT